MRTLKIKRTDLEWGFELSSHEMTAYLDSETGSILYVDEETSRRLDELLGDEATLTSALDTIQAQIELDDEIRKQMIDAARVEWDVDGQFLLVPKQDSREGYRDMEAFISTVQNEQLRELLRVAINGSGAFRRFKEVLYNHSETQDLWFRFKDEREQQRMLDWLESQNIEPEFE